jgi:hypothetical protein
MAVVTDAFNVRICQALGLDPTIVKSVSIELRAQDVPLVFVVQYVVDDQGNKIAEELKRYTLTEWPS